MALLGFSLCKSGIFCRERPDRDAISVLAEALNQLPEHAPVIILVHGYRFHPEQPGCDPHRLIYALNPARGSARVKSWPAGLGFGTGAEREGLCIGFGWPATASASLRQMRLGAKGFTEVYHRAAHVGLMLGQLLGWITELAPERRVNIMAHSLGARVVLQAIRVTHKLRLGQVILLGAAEFASVARQSMSNDTMQRAAFYNVSARDNYVFDLMFERFAPTPLTPSRCLGLGLGLEVPNWFDLDLDAPTTRALLDRRNLGLGVAKNISHWSFYTRNGALALYNDMIRNRHSWAIADLRQEVTGTRRLRIPAPPGSGPTTTLPAAILNSL